MRLNRSRASTAAAVACAAALVLGGTSAALAQGSGSGRPSSPTTDATSSAPSVDRTSALVVLTEEPLSTAVSTRTATGRVALGSGEARQHRRRLTAEKSAFRAWLRTNAPKVAVVGSHDVALNAVSVKLNGEPLATLRRAPQVSAAQFQAVYVPLGHEDPQLALTDFVDNGTQVSGDPDAGLVTGGESDGYRVKVGVVDTGIDPAHPCFADTGYPGTTQTGPTGLTNNKVIVAKVFSNTRGVTPQDMNGHGTHVAGTIGCNVHQTAEIDNGDNDAEITEANDGYAPSGVAPAVQLGNYTVFPGPDSSARSEDILNALEAAFADGMDLVNMSLGGGASGIQDLLTIAVDNLDRAGMVSVVAAGNDGPSRYSVGSPGSAERALTAGASSVGHFVGTPVTIAGLLDPIGAASGDFPTVTAGAGLTADLGVVTTTTQTGTTVLSVACSALPSASLTGEIAVISRGTCTFSQKLRVVQDAGAVGALVVNNTAGDPTAMGTDGAATQPTIPSYMVSTEYRAALLGSDGQAATISPDLTYFADTGNDLIMAAFSSQGPTDVDWRIKPDVVAPGVNVLSAQPLAFCPGETSCWAFYQGTSMATPHVAGAAAVVIDAFRSVERSYTSEEIRSAIVNTAEQGVLTSRVDGTTVVTDVNVVGAGQLDLDSAVAAVLGVGPVTTSFGRVPGGSGQTRTEGVRLSSLSGQAFTVTLVLTGSDAVDFALGSTSVEVPATGSVTVPVSVTVPRGTSTGDHQGQVDLLVGGQKVAHTPLYVRVG